MVIVTAVCVVIVIVISIFGLVALISGGFYNPYDNSRGWPFRKMYANKVERLMKTEPRANYILPTNSIVYVGEQRSDCKSLHRTDKDWCISRGSIISIDDNDEDIYRIQFILPDISKIEYVECYTRDLIPDESRIPLSKIQKLIHFIEF